MKLRERIDLKSGKNCELIKIEGNMIPEYYLITFPKTQGQPNSSEVSEMIEISIYKAKSIAKEFTGDAEAYSLIYSGYSSRREKGWHVHIVLVGNRWKKAWLYFVLTFKNLLQALRIRKDDSPETYV